MFTHTECPSRQTASDKMILLVLFKPDIGLYSATKYRSCLKVFHKNKIVK